jgi:hypothetical protein
MPASIYTFIAIATVLWLAGVTACFVTLRWSTSCPVTRFPATLILSAAALAIGYLGFTKFQVTFTRTVNGNGWSISSKWFFLALILLAAVSLSIACWKRFRQNRNPETGDPTGEDSTVASSS